MNPVQNYIFFLAPDTLWAQLNCQLRKKATQYIGVNGLDFNILPVTSPT